MRLNAIGPALLCAGLVTASLPAQEAKKPAPAKAKPAPATDEKAMMEAWQAAATPGAPHQSLAVLEGTWTAKVKSWMAPGAPPAESEGTADNKMTLGGRFLEQRFQGSFMGQPFNGIGYTGYDNVKKKYVSTWMDSMGTMIMVTEGTADPAGKVITATGTIPDAFTKKTAAIKSVMTVVAPDHHMYEMWGPAPNGKVYKNLEIHYYKKN